VRTFDKTILYETQVSSQIIKYSTYSNRNLCCKPGWQVDANCEFQ